MNQMKLQKPKKNVNMESLCRVCSQFSSHSLFAPIPLYLHENSHEAAEWKMPINYLLHKVTNLPVQRDDGLPQNICVLCISYLKHAYTFRKQAIANVLIFKTNQLDHRSTGKYNGSLSIFNETQRKQRTNSKEFHEITPKQSQANKKYEVVDKSSPNEFDDVAPTPKKAKEYFERSFEEDDITLMEVFQENSNIQFTIPETHRERKCISCRQRFMFDETFNDHINECVQLKLVIFIQDVHQLLVLKESQRISGHEFVRRIIFAVKKCATYLERSNLMLESAAKSSDDEAEEEVTAASATLPNLVPPVTQKPLELSCFNYYDAEESAMAKFNYLSLPPPPTTFASKCDTCELTFDTVANLEIHNFKFHNKLPPKPNPTNASMTVTELANQQKLIELFENDNFSVDYLKTSKLNNNKNLNNKEPTTPTTQPVDLIKNNLKLAKCQHCDERFYTISHLDEHVLRKHSVQQAKPQNDERNPRWRNKDKAKEMINSFNYYS